MRLFRSEGRFAVAQIITSLEMSLNRHLETSLKLHQWLLKQTAKAGEQNHENLNVIVTKYAKKNRTCEDNILQESCKRRSDMIGPPIHDQKMK